MRYSMKNSIVKIITLTLLPFAIESAAMTDYNQMLLKGAASGNLDLINKALANGANINYVDSNDFPMRTALHFASIYNNIEIITTLINAKANIDAKDYIQSTPLHYAAGHSRAEIVNILIKSNANIDAQNNYQVTPLNRAAESGHIEIAKILIKTGAAINCKDKLQRTPLHWAARYGHTEIVDMLLKSGTNFNDSDLKTSLELAKESNYTSIAIAINKVIKNNKTSKIMYDLIIEEINIPSPLARLIAEYAKMLKLKVIDGLLA